ncbi:replication protein [Desulfonema magnum]|uniref:Bacteriophage lambda Replication protein O N-terminal domain-containing protein n=1 Tax=Desulfonema magnum TaxID=45655 RepID=A0A975BFZ8_9BACT|nr:replication protein [Desulfonema magnum]QTA84590.1 Uncharacterized protein dnm_005890 [Desulfonema magnum]
MNTARNFDLFDRPFTITPNDMFNKFIEFPLPPLQRQIVDYIIRNTYGWHRETCEKNLKEIQKITKIKHKSDICRAIRILTEKQIIICENKMLRINTDVAAWGIVVKNKPKSIPVSIPVPEAERYHARAKVINFREFQSLRRKTPDEEHIREQAKEICDEIKADPMQSVSKDIRDDEIKQNLVKPVTPEFRPISKIQYRSENLNQINDLCRELNEYVGGKNRFNAYALTFQMLKEGKIDLAVIEGLQGTIRRYEAGIPPDNPWGYVRMITTVHNQKHNETIEISTHRQRSQELIEALNNHPELKKLCKSLF